MDDIISGTQVFHSEDQNLSTLGWGLFWKQLLGQAGALLLLAGIICFFAFNWADMPAFAKFGVIIVGMLLAAAIPLAKGLDHFAGSLGLLFCGLLAGPLLAVFGQVYQTGADDWELFRVWALFLIPLALLGRQTGLWCATWLISSLWAILWLKQHQYIDDFTLRYPPFLLGQFAFLLLWESFAAAALRGLTVPRPLACLIGPLEENSFLSSRWFPRLLGFCVLSILTWIMLEWVTELTSGRYSSDDSGGFLWTMPYCLLLVAGGWWYARIRPDALMHALGLFSLASVLLTWIISGLFRQAADPIVAFLLSSLLFIGSGVAVGKAILVLRKKNQQMLAALQARRAVREEKFPEMWTRVRQLWHIFRLTVGIPEQPTQAEEAGGPPAMPWYGRLFTSLCAWVASFMLIGFLVMVFENLWDFLGKHVLLLGAVFFFPLGFVLDRRKNLFPQQFGLALLFAGTACLIAWLLAVLRLENPHAYIVLAAVLITSCLLVRNEAYCCLGTFLWLCFLPSYAWFLLQTSTSQFSYMQMPYTEEDGFSWLFLKMNLFGTISISLLFLFCCVSFAHLWRLRHIPPPEGFSAFQRAVLRPFVYGVFVALLCWGGLATIGGGDFLSFQTVFLVGPAAGIALTYLVVRLSNDLGLAPAVRLGAALSAIGLTVISWWLPWVGVGLFALALARQAGNIPLQGLCIAFLAVFLNIEYYNLNTSLLFKSMTLCSLGLLLLLTAFGISRLLKKAIRAGHLPDPGNIALEAPETLPSDDPAQPDATAQEPSHA